MISKITLAAALVLGAASATLADDLPYTAEKHAYLRNPNAPVPTYTLPGQPLGAPAAVAPQPRGQLIEGRNVGVGVQYPVPSDQKHWFERAPIDFNS